MRNPNRSPVVNLLRTPRSAFRADAGFTLIEVLIVVGIIIFLVGISFTVIGSILTTTREKATQATIFKVRELLVQRQEAFERWANDKQQHGLVHGRGRGAASSIGLNPNQQSERVIDLLGRKQLFKEQFAQQASDNSALPAGTSSAEALYIFLTTAGGFDSDVVAADRFSSNEIADTDGDGQLELVDAWGNPLHYYRWPTGRFEAGVSLSSAIPDDDPDDQYGDLQALVNSSVLDATDFKNVFHAIDEYHIPIVVSTGADGLLGLTGPLAANETGSAAADARSDNIYSHELQAGGN